TTAAPEDGTGTKLGDTLGDGNGLSFTSASGNYSLHLGFWGQIRFQLFDRDQFRRTSRTIVVPPIPVEHIGGTEQTFDIPRARCALWGNAFRPWLTYKVEADLVANDEGLRQVFLPPVDPISGANAVLIRAGAEDQDGRTLKLVDFYLDGAPRTAVGFRVGQFKVPQGRQELVTDTKLQMTVRSIASNFFAPGRDRGIV